MFQWNRTLTCNLCPIYISMILGIIIDNFISLTTFHYICMISPYFRIIHNTIICISAPSSYSKDFSCNLYFFVCRNPNQIRKCTNSFSSVTWNQFSFSVYFIAFYGYIRFRKRWFYLLRSFYPFSFIFSCFCFFLLSK